jgi:EAL domain-containing protein (putative c-di-GMP-specific phosphodiesterase class I)
MEQVEFPPHSLEVELTEDTLAQPTPVVLANLTGLRSSGVMLSVDDFGTGYSNMASLKSLPISVIKIDQSLIRDMMNDPSDHSVVEAVILLSRKLGHMTVAEGVETEAQRHELQRLGCDIGQGFLVSKPVPIDEFEKRFLPAKVADIKEES